MAATEGPHPPGALLVVSGAKPASGWRIRNTDQLQREKVSAEPSEALAGKEVTTRNTGTLGPVGRCEGACLAARTPPNRG